MPPVRSMPMTKPVRTERTHEENQERAYIAASRRSDRSLEARVESARRASEIHKKRTGRSLRVREEDVLNEEMYEEEDDDLPMQYRRISAINPSFLNGRLGSYLMGQAGLQAYLRNAIYDQNQQNNQFPHQQFLQMMSANGQLPNSFAQPQGDQSSSGQPMQNVQGTAHNGHTRAASIATPQELTGHQRQSQSGNMNPPTPTHLDARRMSMPGQTVSPGVFSSASHPQSPASTRSTFGMPPMPTTMPGYDPQIEAQIYPLTTKIPLATAQLMGSNATHPADLSPTVLTPSMGAYSYHPNGKPKRSSSSDGQGYFSNGLNETLSPADMHSNPPFNTENEPQSAASAPPAFDQDFTSMMSESNISYDNFNDMTFLNGYASGEITPASNGIVDSYFDFDGGFIEQAAE